jgi:hypothetical protein
VRPWAPAFRRARRPPRIHKPSTAVSFGLPDLLSVRVRDHVMVTADRGQTPTGKASGQAANRPDPPSSGECNGCEDGASKGKAQEIKGEPAAGLCGIDVIGGRAKPEKYGRCYCCLGHGAAWATGRQAFLRQPAFAYETLWKVDVCSFLASSTGRRNTGVKSLCWCFKLQGLTWSFV